MKTIFIAIISSVALLTTISAQDIVFKQELTQDTILWGNIIQLRYSVENVAGDFEAPSFEGFHVVSGPNVSSSFSMINGRVSQSASYTYYLRPISEGIHQIDAAYLKNGDSSWSTSPIEIVVLPNPEGIIESPRGFGFEQQIVVRDSSMTKKDSLQAKIKKLKTVKI